MKKIIPQNRGKRLTYRGARDKMSKETENSGGLAGAATPTDRAGGTSTYTRTQGSHRR